MSPSFAISCESFPVDETFMSDSAKEASGFEIDESLIIFVFLRRRIGDGVHNLVHDSQILSFLQNAFKMSNSNVFYTFEYMIIY